jgi:hypothetical protein
VAQVDTILALHARLAVARTPDAQTHLAREIAATDRAIDALVYELYELTPEEIRIVEAATAPPTPVAKVEPEDEPAAPELPQGESTPQSEADAAHFYFVTEDPPKKE